MSTLRGALFTEMITPTEEYAMHRSFRLNVNRLARVATLGAALSAVLCLAGCNTVRQQRLEIPSPADGWEAPAAIDIENFHGSVTIIVDPSVQKVEPTFKTHASIWVQDVIRKQAIESIKIRTGTTNHEGRAVYSVRASTKWIDPKQVWVDITLRMPRCDGVRIYNRGGDVRLSGVGGAIQIDNGEFADTTGGIEVRTDQAITDPVALLTTNGNVVFQVGPGSTGEFTLDAQGGEESFDSNILRPGMVHTNGAVTTASVRGESDETNAVLLRTGKGDATVIYMADPMKYTRRVP